MFSKNKIVFAWWNTSLAPSGKSRSTAEQRMIACRVIINLINQAGADFIALGEMSQDDFDFIAGECDHPSYSFHSGITRAGKSSFDICYICNELKITVLSEKDVISLKGNSTLKIAKRVDLGVLEDGSIFHILVSHWPSRLWCEQHDARRHIFGLRLRDTFDSMCVEDEPTPYVIMLGDYNDEPFDESLSEQVMGSRDVDLVRRKKHLLYNPFWRYLCKQTVGHHGSGSYFYKGGAVTKWHTFDQLMFSQAFLTSDNWVYNHDCDLILEIPELVELVKNPNFIFDHLPVYGIVEKVIQNG
ncbi:endonuclease/exonuclease/phosphatase family protein [Pseudomonas californiensis]|uniref:endonuclease/exonuclease/phosphatase family protein n=1 Tax=Pseudomonas californiensis TaxID=2829823 RepID=UPI001E3D2409|nr:hypothetical protein [Pseudomonas californiensis]